MYGARPTTRLLSMLELLQSRGRISGSELGRRLEVGERTIRRYAVKLQEMGVPVEGERGRYGAYRLQPGYRLPPMMFTEDEALGLTLSLMAARRLGLSGAAPAVEGALAKLERVMPDALSGRVGALEKAISLAVPGPENPARADALLLLAAAVEERRQVWISYRASGRETERDVDPYGVLNREGYWYFVGYCHLREGLRLFRVDRVLEARLTGEEFVRPAEMDSQGALLDAIATGDHDRYSVEVLLLSKDVKWQLPAFGFALDEVGEGTIVRCATFDLDWVARVLSDLDCDFVIHGPDELRDEVANHARKLLRLVEREETPDAEPQIHSKGEDE